MKKIMLGMLCGFLLLLNACMPTTDIKLTTEPNLQLNTNALNSDFNADIHLIKRPRPKPTPTPKPLKTPEPKPQPKPSLKQV